MCAVCRIHNGLYLSIYLYLSPSLYIYIIMMIMQICSLQLLKFGERFWWRAYGILAYYAESVSKTRLVLSVPFLIVFAMYGVVCVNSLRPRQNRRHFADDIFKCNFLNENVWILIKISLKFVPKGTINNIPTLLQIMAWRRPGDKPLSEPMLVRIPTHICVTRPQWVKPAHSSLGFREDIFMTHLIIIIKWDVSAFPSVVMFSVYACLRWLYHHMLSVSYIKITFIIALQYHDVCRWSSTYGPMVLSACLHITLPHVFACLFCFRLVRLCKPLLLDFFVWSIYLFFLHWQMRNRRPQRQ